jgi:beta-propeller repeat-containing protein
VRSQVLVALIVAAVPATGSAQTVQWIRQFGTPAQDRALAIAVHASGVYVAGATQGELPGQKSAGAIDAFLGKYDTNGVGVWTRQFGTPGIDEILAIAVDDSGIYVAGDTQGALAAGAPSGPHAFIRKYDLNGTEAWTREFGSGRREEVLALAAGVDGVYAAGDTTVAAPPYDDAFVAVFAADGKARGGHEFGTAAVDRAAAIAVNATGVYVAGATQGTLPGQTAAGDSDCFVRKYGLDGAEIWIRQFGTSAADEILSMAADASGLYLAGTTSGAIGGQAGAGAVDAFVSRYDFNGQPVWTRQFGTPDYDDSLGIAASARGVYVAGNTRGALPGQVNAGDYDAFVRKYDAGGGAAWTQQFGSSAHDEALSISTDDSGVYAPASPKARCPVNGAAAAPMRSSSSWGKPPPGGTTSKDADKGGTSCV